jgi:hypothetical protein
MRVRRFLPLKSREDFLHYLQGGSSMNTRLVRRLFSAVVIAAVAGVSYTVGAVQGAKAVSVPFASLKWEPAGPGSPLSVASLWGGDRTKSKDHGILLKLPASLEAGAHTHTADYHAVAIQGAWIHTNDASKNGREYPVGSYVFQPGKQVHNDICKGPGDCILFLHQHGPADFVTAKSP